MDLAKSFFESQKDQAEFGFEKRIKKIEPDFSESNLKIE